MTDNNNKTITDFEAGMLTQAITNLTEQFRLLSEGVNQKIDRINEKLNGLADAFPTRREYDQLKDDVDELAKTTLELQNEAAENKTANRILWIIITALLLTGLGAVGLTSLGTMTHGITH